MSLYDQSCSEVAAFKYRMRAHALVAAHNCTSFDVVYLLSYKVAIATATGIQVVDLNEFDVCVL